MTRFPRTDRTGLETWLASQITDLASTLPPPHAGLLLLDAQLTDLENRCAAAHIAIVKPFMAARGRAPHSDSRPLPAYARTSVR
jgi:hypothetical protein